MPVDPYPPIADTRAFDLFPFGRECSQGGGAFYDHCLSNLFLYRSPLFNLSAMWQILTWK